MHGGNCKMRVQLPSRIMTQTSLASPEPMHFRKVNSFGKSAADERFSTTALKALTTFETLMRLCFTQFIERNIAMEVSVTSRFPPFVIIEQNAT